MDRADVRYTEHEGAHVAYQVLGQGPPDMVFMPDWFTNLEVQWDEPAFARTLTRLASSGRLVLFDKRGIGLSDPVRPEALPSIESWSTDALAVLDAVGSEKAAVIAAGAAGFLALSLAAHHPERVTSLILLGATARVVEGDDYPVGIPKDLVDLAMPQILRMWGTGEVLRLAAPDREVEKPVRDWFARLERVSASPGVVAAVEAMVLALDVRDLLPKISLPTLVIHRTGDRITPIAQARYLAERIPEAQLRELAGSAHLIFGDSPSEWIDEAREFITGARGAAEADRVLTTVLLTDIVDSTVHAERMGNERFQELKHRHEQMVRRQVRSHGGIVIDTVGDAHMSRFDSPAGAVRCARDMVRAARDLDIEIRAGLHSGEVEVSEAGISGLTINIGARVCARAGASQILVSRTVVDLMRGYPLAFQPVGTFKMKGVSGRWQLFEVGGRQRESKPSLA